ncbi:MAG: ribosome maturation factor RimM [Symbiobacteriaceae bacterium]|nr:ribosome maturation factor RimM [Symbiobacteriaceae bacterium]
MGKIVAAQGLKGEMRVLPLTDFPERFATTRELVAYHPNGKMLTLHPQHAREHKGVIILKCQEIENIAQLQPWIQAELTISPDQLQELPPGRYYIFQVLGLQVYTEEGLHLGELVDVLTPGANDVYVVQLTPEASAMAQESDGKELLLPVIDEVILTTDLASGRLTVRLIPGLL